MSIFLSITLVAMLTVFCVDVMQKRREFLKQHQNTQKNDF
jgi:hypothetical protein